MDLDKLRSQSEWPTVADAASSILQNEPDNVTAKVASVEARTYAALANAGLYSTDNLSKIGDPTVPALLREALKITPTKQAEAECACAVGQLLLLDGRPQQALEVLANVDAQPSREYLRAIVLKHRALLGGAYAALGDSERAFQTFNTVEVSDRTLQGMPEAARWAEVLYNKSVDTSNHNPDVFVRLQALRRYARAVRLGGLSGRPNRLQELEELLRALAVRQPSQDFGDEIAGVAALRAADTATKDSTNTHPSTQPVSSTSAMHLGHKSHNGGVTPHTSDTNGGVTPHAPPSAETETPAERTIRQSAPIEKQAEAEVDHWRQTQPLQPPYNIAVGPAVEPTEALLAQLTLGGDSAINRTFDSAVLMRLNTELLLALDRLPEAQAAFDTYVTYQALQLLKRKSGAHADPDSEAGTAHIFGLMAAVVETEAYRADAGYAVVDRAAKLAAQLERVMPTQDAVAVGAAHGVLARCLELEAARAVGNDYFSERSAVEATHFDKALQHWPGDPPFHRARAQYLMRSAGPAETFAYLHPVLQQYPADLPLAHLLVLVLTAQDEYETALAVADAALAEWPPAAAHTEFARYQLLELLKTKAAIIEALQGASAALNELPEIMSAVGILYPQPPRKEPDTKAKANGSAVKGGNTAGARAGAGAGAAAGAAAAAKERATVSPEGRANLAALWVWIAGLYTRAEQYAEAQEALQEARGASAADVAAMRGHIAQAPAEKYRRFTEALALDPFHLGAALGQAGVLVRHGRVNAGVVDAAKPSAIFRSAGEEMSQVLAALSGLEDLTTRYPGRSTSEAWYGLGALYEALGDAERAREAFWRSVGLDEKTGVREVRV